jgi:membrane protease subunit HflC
MKNIGLILGGGLILALLILVASATYVVNETQQVVVTQFGRVVGEPVTDPGLHFKAPFVQKANYYEKRFLEWDGDPNQIPTKDKRFIHVDTYARWRINDPRLFRERLETETLAQSRLDDILDGETRNTVAKHNLIEVVRSTNREFDATAEIDQGEMAESLEIESGRSQLALEVLEAASAGVMDLGIEVLDFRFKRITYQADVQRNVYDRMISERQRIAERFRSEGGGESARINGEKERQLKEITSEAYRQAQEIKGRADAEAARIYARAYNRDPEFYRFLKTMETYRETIDADTTLVLTTDGDFYRYLDKAR